ncbi:hypothetical protein [Nocardia cyriacigeorgica]|uniref:hypothetical protein n=1 Tax=Nocardia cyriacigeorgica TaxID=135487 RepID=UPI001893A7EC|nr:hypothetical protein [Nocardia cyriacigeorgica]MBF6452639.1 hypothetical protein [Nocardia cyriacigeorgica]MBF6477943.1 hypothetical protein [Nocardia cyriacigeorgica]MBF6549808.1 hypothetical protein [Nocardia cyriacigeorgica]
MYILPDFDEVVAQLDDADDESPLEQVPLRERVGVLDEDLRAPLAAYLDQSNALWVTASIDDPLDPSKKRVVSIGYSTDGTWTWPSYWGYFVRQYGVEVPAEFIAHVRERNFAPGVLDRDALRAAEREFEKLLG